MSELRKFAFRERGDSYLRDAENKALGLDSRATLAFDAAYMYALSVLDGDVGGLEHPHPDVLQAAAVALRWKAETFGTALNHLNNRRATTRNTQQLNELVALANRLKLATA